MEAVINKLIGVAAMGFPCRCDTSKKGHLRVSNNPLSVEVCWSFPEQSHIVNTSSYVVTDMPQKTRMTLYPI